MKSKLTFGYLYDFRNPPAWRQAWSELYASTLEFITHTEQLGFGGAWVPEHHGAEDGYMPSPLVMLAAIAARTRTMKLGSAIALAPLYHPVRFAEECAVLDILSDGRLEMAVAVGYRRREAQAYGVDFTTRGRRLDEFLEIVRRLWSGENFSYDGRFYQLKDVSIVPIPPRKRVPLYLGGFNARAIERTAKYGDGYFGNVEIIDLYREQLAADGQDPAEAKIRIQGLFNVVAHDPEQAMEELAPYFHHANNAYGAWLNEDRDATGFAEAATLKPMSLAQFKTSGILHILTPSQAIDMFTTLLAKAPIEHYMLMYPPGMTAEKFAPYAETFAKDVMPAFR